ncbi:MAG: ABC transporter ATP-binding protein [Anaerolineales bacterium]|nr:ABC transporter ATP-binding protein [Anaerolineales bacterium]
MTRVSLLGVSRRFGRTPAVAGLSLEVESGELAALLGPSGCGKTTTLRLIAGLLKPEQGDIHFDGRSMAATPAERRGAVMVFQHPLLFPHLNVHDNVAFGLRAQRVPEVEIRRAVSDMLERVRLAGFERRRPRELSGGQAQRVALARALVTRPRLLLLDEPLSSLDPHLRDEMRALIRELHADLGLTTLLVTHDQQDAALLADRIAVLFHGRLAQHGRLRDLFDRPATVEVARFFGGVNFMSGTLDDGALASQLGRLRLAEPPPGSGPATATIRPEAVRWLGAGAAREHRCNQVLGVVERVVDLGSFRRLTARAGAVSIEAHLRPDEAAPVAGQVGVFELPAEHLWVLPRGTDDNCPTRAA